MEVGWRSVLRTWSLSSQQHYSFTSGILGVHVLQQQKNKRSHLIVWWGVRLCVGTAVSLFEQCAMTSKSSKISYIPCVCGVTIMSDYPEEGVLWRRSCPPVGC